MRTRMKPPPFGSQRDVIRRPARMEHERAVPFANKVKAPTGIGELVRHASDEVWDLSHIQSYLARTVERILEHRLVPKTAVQPPRMEIAVPAIEAMRYCRLRNELSALIATSMDRRTVHRAHPAFVDVLKQLTRDELALLALFPSDQQVIPSGHLHAVSKSGET